MSPRSIFMSALVATLVASPLGALASTAAEQEPEELAESLVHSDLPIYSFAWEEFYPRNFSDEDGFGCTSRVDFGDWKFTPSAANAFGSERWTRISHYGVFHCAANIYEAGDQQNLDQGDFSRGFFALIGTAELEGEALELWVLQEGFRTGSDYRLFARRPSDGLVDAFIVLQTRCPSVKVRETEDFDTWLTRYCAINTHEELLALAVEMAALEPLGTFEKQEKGPDASAPDPLNPDISD